MHQWLISNPKFVFQKIRKAYFTVDLGDLMLNFRGAY